MFATHHPPATPLNFNDALHSSSAKGGVFLESARVSFDTVLAATDIIRLATKDILSTPTLNIS
jgi:hypothetical protein